MKRSIVLVISAFSMALLVNCGAAEPTEEIIDDAALIDVDTAAAIPLETGVNSDSLQAQSANPTDSGVVQALEILPDWLRDDCTLHLPESMQKVLTAFKPNFVVWTIDDFSEYCGQPPLYGCNSRETAFATIGDYNGDQLPDIALMGHTDTHEFLIALVSDGETYEAHEIDSYDEVTDTDEYKLGICLRHFGPEKLESAYEELVLDLTNDAIHQLYCEKSSLIFYYEGGTFLPYTTGD